MADVHFAEVYPDLEDLAIDGIPSTDDGKPILIRTMESQLHSTRLFNENYVAFKTAVEDAVNRGVKIIAIPGDFSDDGQPIHIKGLKKLLKHFTVDYGVSFFMINGNHDPTRPFGKEGGERDFLAANGKAQPIMSKMGMYTPDVKKENQTLITKEIADWGYEDIVNELSEFGFFPNKTDVYWETPFSNYTYQDYKYNIAKESSKLEKRTYFFEESTIEIPDVSYMVEPVAGLWLLALDANVYMPTQDRVKFEGAGIGYNEVLKHKKYLIDWTAKVIKEADRLGKTVIAFSHYPMIEFNDGASDEMKVLFGESSFQAHRVPSEIVGHTFADIGLKVHVGGHMHLNDTGVITTKNGNSLTNIQTPSLAAYKPGYKIITVNNQVTLKVETVLLDSVLGFNTFFKWYKKEHEFLKANFPNRVWNYEILSASSYASFTNAHLKSLVKLRFLKEDWPTVLQDQLVDKTGWQLLLSASKFENINFQISNSNSTEEGILKILKGNGLSKNDFQHWTGIDLIVDFYRFRNGDQLALKDISPKRLKSYELLFQILLENSQNKSLKDFQQFAEIFKKQMNGEPAVNFTIDW